MRVLEWFNAAEAAEFGTALADQFAPPQAANAAAHDNTGATAGGPDNDIQEILQRADREVRGLKLNFYKKAKFANSFKWRLLENGVEKALADEMTQTLVLHLSGNPVSSTQNHDANAAAADRPQPNDAKRLLALGNKSIAQGDYDEAIAIFQDLIKLNPRHAIALNNLGSALFKVGRYKEAEACFYRAIKVKADFADPHSNLGNLLLLRGYFVDAERSFRYALKINPRFVDARNNLGLVLANLNNLRDAKSNFEKVLKNEPRSTDALRGLALVARAEGRFDDAGAMLDHALQIDPKMPGALSSFVSLRKMTTADSAWLHSAEEVAASGITPSDESDLRFAIGKYYDDVEDFKLAFRSYQRANDLLKPLAEPYDREARGRFVDDLIRVYARETMAGVAPGASNSHKPIFVLGMPRSGTSLTEQIIASHPSVKGAGELDFWPHAGLEQENAVRQGLVDESTRRKLAEAYLRALETRSGSAQRIVDKTPLNCDFLGLIHSAFPNGRIIYMRRDPIDTCLSCYFQKFSPSLNFTMDLSDLANYYRDHHRLMAHWRAVLPPGTILDVPYAELVADQEGWTRKILEFLDLEWNERVLDFQDTQRIVVTASSWQVRQKIYTNSVRRWRNYQKFIEPLRRLEDLA
jgi:tetratricopeptide (TPR) repeat protein